MASRTKRACVSPATRLAMTAPISRPVSKPSHPSTVAAALRAIASTATTSFVVRARGRSPDFRIVLLPAPSRLSPVAVAGFVPGYSDGVAADSHRLPWALVGTPGARTGPRLAEFDAGCNRVAYDASRA